MSTTPIELARKIKDIVQHVQPMPSESATPFPHYQKTSTDLWNLIRDVGTTFARSDPYPQAWERHLIQINSMVLMSLIENFERYLKEIAAACVDHLAGIVLDDRLNIFQINGSTLASHFGTDTLGKSLCESGTWLNCEEINSRFRKLLSEPFQDGKFYLFPKANQLPVDERWRFPILGLIWQLRHSIVHNVGIVTQSDAVKLRLWSRETVASPRVLAPTEDDLRYVKRFLDETAEVCNQRVGERLAELLTNLLNETPDLFSPQIKADQLTAIFGDSLSVGGCAGVVPL